MKIKTGDKIWMLTAIHRVENKGVNVQWLFKCDCGNERIIGLGNVSGGNTKSCGCLKSSQAAKKMTTHGDTIKINGRVRSEYKIWSAMIERCTNPNNKAFFRYGMRGISVCHRWRSSYEAFLFDMGRRPSNRHCIDRINNEGNYEPVNCRWATYTEQGKNKSNNHWLEYNGKKMILQDWARELGVADSVIWFALHRRKGKSFGDYVEMRLKKISS